MRLAFINYPLVEFKFKKAVNKIWPLLQHLPPEKQDHSINVAKTLHNIGVGKTAVYAGLLHDYLERGGTLAGISNHLEALRLPSEVLRLVLSLSSDEKNTGVENEPLKHMRQVIGSNELPEDEKNLLIIIKLSDRLDNLSKRIRLNGKIEKDYLKRSNDLINYLTSEYTGKKKHFRKLIDLINQIIS